MAKKDDIIEVEGVVKTVLPGSEYIVEVREEQFSTEVRGYLSGKMKKHFIRIIPGDIVKIELTPYDLNKGRIVRRSTNTELKKKTFAQAPKTEPEKKNEDKEAA